MLGSHAVCLSADFMDMVVTWMALMLAKGFLVGKRGHDRKKIGRRRRQKAYLGTPCLLNTEEMAY